MKVENGAVKTAKSNGRSMSNGKATTPAKADNGKTTEATQTVDATEVEKLKAELKHAQEIAAKAGKEAQENKAKADDLSKKLEETKPLNVADALVKIQEAKAIAEKLEFLRDTRKQLSSFALGNSGLAASFELKDNSGQTFKSTNTETLELVLGLLKSELDNKIQTTEKTLLEAV